MNKVVLSAMGVWILLHPSTMFVYVAVISIVQEGEDIRYPWLEEQSIGPFSKQSAVKRVSFQEELTRVAIVTWLRVAMNADAAFGVKHSHNSEET
eukprot:scaffold4102_cov76-Skeletonema_dohrnii-CCMP3373.AAC.2